MSIAVVIITGTGLRITKKVKRIDSAAIQSIAKKSILSCLVA